MLRRLAIGLSIGLLASCGTGAPDRLAQLKTVTAGFGKQPAPVDPRDGLTPAVLATVTTPVLFAAIPSRGAQATMVPAGTNGDAVTWLTSDGIGLVFKGGVLVATRGLGLDLMAADVAGTRNAMLRGGKDVVRIHDYLSPEDRIERIRFVCTVTPDGPETITIVGQSYKASKITERCVGTETRFINVFWRGATGTMLRSHQFVSPEVGYLDTERLTQ
ncbi:YjbF family lipoprotein [Pseudogemmobacter sp. W21_MBD1_M6]|uniref:YjbF family lipoprotein n=1 Tax=Pseudogemmobacter sp. W21_MBD1_M6 TaxID=3240271 RepID=UPI003F9B47EA